MAQVSVTINGRAYRMACDDGQEKHLTELGARLDAKIAAMRGTFGEIGDMRLTVMAAITLSDELFETHRRIAALEADLRAAQGASVSVLAEVEAAESEFATAINRTAERIERLGRTLSIDERSGAAEAPGIRPGTLPQAQDSD